MRFIRAAAVQLTLAAASLQAAADPGLLGLVMPEAKSISGVHVEQCRISPFGQFLITQLGPLPPFEELKTMTGFDPRTDLTEIVAASAGPTATLIAGRGVFQPTRILTTAQSAGAATSTYRGMTLIATDPGQTAAVAFLDASTVVFGTTASVHGAIDRWVAATPYTGPLTAKVAEVSASSHAWAVSTGLSEFLPAVTDAPPQAQLMQNLLAAITQMSGNIVFGETTVQVRGKLETRSAQDAQSMADMLRFFASMVPQPGLANAATFTNAGSVVDIKVSLTEQQVEELLKPHTGTGLQAEALPIGHGA